MPGHVELLSSLILCLLLLSDPLTTHAQSLFSQAVAFNRNRAYYLDFMHLFWFALTVAQIYSGNQVFCAQVTSVFFFSPDHCRYVNYKCTNTIEIENLLNTGSDWLISVSFVIWYTMLSNGIWTSGEIKLCTWYLRVW